MLVFVSTCSIGQEYQSSPQVSPDTKALLQETADKGRVRVIVSLNTPGPAPATVAAIAQTQAQLLEDLSQYSVEDIRRYRTVPLLLLEVGSPALRYLIEHPLVLSVEPDRPSHTMMPLAR